MSVSDIINVISNNWVEKIKCCCVHYEGLSFLRWV
jgi:hypothetical protein